MLKAILILADHYKDSSSELSVASIETAMDNIDCSIELLDEADRRN